MVSETNQEKRVEWCKERKDTRDMDFNDVVFSDECTVQLESHRRLTFYKKGQPVKYKMKAKHPPKVNVWAGISCRGATKVVVFTGILTATKYVDILDAALIPLLPDPFPTRLPSLNITVRASGSHPTRLPSLIITASGSRHDIYSSQRIGGR